MSYNERVKALLGKDRQMAELTTGIKKPSHAEDRAREVAKYSELWAKYDSVGDCGHPIKKGEHIGFNFYYKKTKCKACWQTEKDAIRAEQLAGFQEWKAKVGA